MSIVFYDRFCTGCKNARRILEGLTRTFKTVNVRRSPVSKDQTLSLVRRHKKAYAKIGPTMKELELAGATDEQILELFLGRDGDRMRAPVLSNGLVIMAGSDPDMYRRMVRG
jgi:arsenate reductase-like glutaredoxin family protein